MSEISYTNMLINNDLAINTVKNIENKKGLRNTSGLSMYEIRTVLVHNHFLC